MLVNNIDLDPNLPGGRVFDRAVIARDMEEHYGFQGATFSGHFNGDGFSVIGLCVTSSSEYVGLFGKIGQGGRVCRMGLQDVQVRSVEFPDHHYDHRGDAHYTTGALAGRNGGMIQNCYSTGLVRGLINTGGLAGENEGVIKDCYAMGIVEAAGVLEPVLGTLVGQNDGYISHCHTTVSTRDEMSSYPDGLIGSGNNADINHCYFLETGDTSESPGRGIPLTSQQMKQRLSFKYWDFYGDPTDGYSDHWDIRENGHPVLVWQTDLTGLARVPDVTGMSTDQAQRLILETGFVLGAIELNSHEAIPVDQIIAADPWAYAPLGSAVSLIQSTGPYVWTVNPGDGSRDNPYQIYSAGQIQSLQQRVDLCDKYFVLTNDIDFRGQTSQGALIAPSLHDSRIHWDFGRPPPPAVFSGQFDGNGHTIANLTIEGYYDYLGVFGHIETHGTVKNIRLSNIQIRGKESHYTGALAGTNRGVIINCEVDADVEASWGVGGIVGTNEGHILNCAVEGMVSGRDRVGGVAGGADVIVNCHAKTFNAQTGSFNSLIGGHAENRIVNSYCVHGDGSIESWSYLSYIRGETPESFANWDFLGETRHGTAETWMMQEDGYPVLSLLNGYQPPLLSGSGTAADPYLVDSPECLGAIVYRPDAYYRLARDIDLAGIDWSTALIPVFYGHFDGAGHIIRNVSIRTPALGGIFGVMQKQATVPDLGIEAGTLECFRTAGMLAAVNRGTLSACYATGFVNRADKIGGLVGFNESGHVHDCYTHITTGKHPSPGLVGYTLSGSIDRCYSIVQVTGAVYGPTHGLIGKNRHSPVSLCFWSTDAVNLAESRGGFGKTVHQMRQASTYTGWGDQQWTIDEKIDYPRLAWEGRRGQVIANIPERTYSGHGTLDDPFVLNCSTDLHCMTARAEEWSSVFELSQDIDMKGVSDYLPAGNFSGCIDGRGHCIRNLTISDGTGPLGLIGFLNGGRIRNLGLEDILITGRGNYVGALAGCSIRGSIRNCFVTGSLFGDRYVGGMVGYLNEGLIYNSFVHVDVIGESDSDSVGGLAGETFQANLGNCYAVGHVSGKQGSYYVGQLVGNYQGGRSLPNRYQGTRLHQCFRVQDPNASYRNTIGIELAMEQAFDVHTFVDAGWDFAGERTNGTAELWTMPSSGGPPQLHMFADASSVPELNGGGIPDNPYQVRSARDLGTMHYYDEDACYELSANIDLSGIAWQDTPIPEFRGVFNGKGYAIQALTVQAMHRVGLFGRLHSDALVTSLNIVEASVMSQQHGRYVGLLTAINEGQIGHCHTAGTIVAKYGSHEIGGIVGYNYGQVSECSALIDISGGSFVGGLVGSNRTGLVRRSYCTGKLSASSNLGGLIGRNEKGSTKDCYAITQLNTSSFAGGLVGFHWQGEITSCYAVCSPAPIQNLSRIGGLVGIADEASTSHSFWDTDTNSITASAGGLGLTTAEMQTALPYLEAGWDFENVWVICEGKDYPRLQWEQVSCSEE